MLSADSRRPHDQVVRTVCGACPTGCGVKFYVKSGRVVDVLGDETHPVNRGALCARGSSVFQHFDHPARLRQPALRQALDQAFSPGSWDEALDFAAGRLKAIVAAHGPAAVVVATAERLDTGDQVGAARFAAALGAQLLPPARPAPDRAAQAIFGAEVAPRLTVPADAWAQRACLLLLGGDPAGDYPVAYRHVLDARARHVPVLAAAPRFTATQAKADFACLLRPGGEAAFLFALFKVICELDDEHGGGDPGRAPALAGLDAWRTAAAELSWETIERLTGRPPSDLQRAGLLWVRHQPGVIIGGGPATATVARAAAGLLALSRQRAPAGQSAGWNWLSAPPTPFATGDGDAPDRAAAPRAVVGSGNFWPGLAASHQADAEFVAQFGAYPDETQQRAHVTLPAASWAEAEGLHVSHDRCIQWQRPVVPAPGQARSALDFWAGLADRLGLADAFPWRRADGRVDVQACAEALLAGSPRTAQLSIGACQAPGGASWPGPEPETGGDARAAVLGEPPDLTVTEPDPGHPLLLCRDVAPEGDAAWWPWRHAGQTAAQFQLNPAVAAALDIADGDAICVDDGHQRLAGRARVTPGVPLRTIWASAGAPGVTPVVVFREQDHLLRSLARLRALFAQIERRA